MPILILFRNERGLCRGVGFDSTSLNELVDDAVGGGTGG